MAWPVVATVTVLFIYSVVLLLFFAGLLKFRILPGHFSPTKTRVTVVIPFRNESAYLPQLIGDLCGQSCSSHLFDVLLVDDHSSDGSLETAASLTAGRPGFTCTELPAGREGKKEALSEAISRAKTEWILQTDGDCRVGSGFVASHLSFLEMNPSDLVAGFVVCDRNSNKLREAMEQLDQLGLAGAGAGSFKLGRPLMCSGANMLYSKSLYRDTRRFDPLGKVASGDDMFLLIGARKLGRKVSFNPRAESVVRTRPSVNLKGLIRQRIRWGAKSVHYQMADLQLLALLVALTNLLVLAGPLWCFIFEGAAPWLISAFGVKSMADFLLLHATSGLTGQRRSLLWFIPVMLVYYPFLAVVATGSLAGRTVWKGRRT
jgi:cellulose synthase/poly-beta-1,6-N-acetylglucosamine synthase-like glycosyltransferase